jgi:ABC-2 type transport system ATP-binding protein
MTAALEAVSLGKRYLHTWALRDCSFSIPEGKIAAFVGPNGAGKSTLMRIAAGFARPTSGSISVFGQSPESDNASYLSRVGYLDQERPLYNGFRVDELLKLGQKLNPSWDEQFALDLLGTFAIPVRRRIRRLSVGQRAQVAAVLCLAKKPDLLLLDEPVAALDPLARRHLMEQLMETVTQRGTTVFLASHVISELEDVCDYLVILAGTHVRVADDIDHVLAVHRLLVGPSNPDIDIPGVDAVVSARHTKRQSTLLVRTTQELSPPGWQVIEPSLDEVVIGYLAEPEHAVEIGHVPGGPVEGRE